MDRISAFMDGESGRQETQQVIRRLKQHPESRASWCTFHLIGDVIRGDSVPPGDAFARRLRERLDTEPTVLAPRFSWRQPVNLALSAAASLAAIAVVLMLVLGDSVLAPQPPIATAPATTVAPQQVAQLPGRPHPVPAAEPGHVNEYLMAHQEFSPLTTWHGVAPYVRTVSSTHHGSGQ